MKQRSRATSQPLHSKSVAFDLGPESHPGDPGYETDDSESTIDARGRSGRRKHQQGRRRSLSVPHSSTPKPGDSGASSGHHHSKQDRESESDSDSTINLPDRFDSQGRLLPEREDDTLAGHFEGILRGISRVFF